MSSVFSYAKINLNLQVLNKRVDGYHNIHSLFLEIDLDDKLIFSRSDEFQLTVENSFSSEIPLDDTNLINRAYKTIKSKIKSVPTEYAIHLKKQIPIGSGLGGGSSNAASILTVLNQLWKLNLSTIELENIGKSLGSDVPFFIKGGIQLVEGIGDILTPLDFSLLKGYYFVLVVPPIHISTPWAYGALNKSLQPNKRQLKFLPLSTSMKWELFDNDFERVIHEAYPEIRKTKAKLQRAGALYAGLSGSGSTVFGVFDNLKKAESILEHFDQYQTYLTSPVFR